MSCVKVTLLYQEVKRDRDHQTQGLRAEQAEKTNLVTSALICWPSANSFVLPILHKRIVCLKDIKTVCSGHFFEPHIFMSSPMCKTKFLFLPLICFMPI